MLRRARRPSASGYRTAGEPVGARAMRAAARMTCQKLAEPFPREAPTAEPFVPDTLRLLVLALSVVGASQRVALVPLPSEALVDMGSDGLASVIGSLRKRTVTRTAFAHACDAISRGAVLETLRSAIDAFAITIGRTRRSEPRTHPRLSLSAATF